MGKKPRIRKSKIAQEVAVNKTAAEKNEASVEQDAIPQLSVENDIAQPQQDLVKRKRGRPRKRGGTSCTRQSSRSRDSNESKDVGLTKQDDRKIPLRNSLALNEPEVVDPLDVKSDVSRRLSTSRSNLTSCDDADYGDLYPSFDDSSEVHTPYRNTRKKVKQLHSADQKQQSTPVSNVSQNVASSASATSLILKESPICSHIVISPVQNAIEDQTDIPCSDISLKDQTFSSLAATNNDNAVPDRIAESNASQPSDLPSPACHDVRSPYQYDAASAAQFGINSDAVVLLYDLHHVNSCSHCLDEDLKRVRNMTLTWATNEDTVSEFTDDQLADFEKCPEDSIQPSAVLCTVIEQQQSSTEPAIEELMEITEPTLEEKDSTESVLSLVQSKEDEALRTTDTGVLENSKLPDNKMLAKFPKAASSSKVKKIDSSPNGLKQSSKVHSTKVSTSYTKSTSACKSRKSTGSGQVSQIFCIIVVVLEKY